MSCTCLARYWSSSSSLVWAQWMSSKTSSVGCLEPDVLDEAPRGVEEHPLLLDPLVSAQPEQEAEVAARLLRLRLRQHLADQPAQLLARGVGRIGVEDPGSAANEVRKPLVPGLPAVGQAAPAEDAAAVSLDERGDLAAEPRLADARRAEERHELRSLLGRRPVPERVDEVELAVPADERVRGDRPLGRRKRRLDGEPRLDRLRLPLRLHGLERLVPDDVARGAMRLGSDDQPPGGRRRLQPRRGVDDVAGRERLPRVLRADRDDRLARVDGGPRRQLEAVRPVQLVERSRIASPARTARSASSPCETGAPKTAIKASPMNFSSAPPCSSTRRFASS